MKAIIQCLGASTRSFRWSLGLVLGFLLASVASAQEESLKQGAKRAGHSAGAVVYEIGQGVKQVGKEIGHGAKQVGKTVGEAAKEGGKEFGNAVKGK